MPGIPRMILNSLLNNITKSFILKNTFSRRRFLKTSATVTGGVLLHGLVDASCIARKEKINVPVDGHLWVYASRYPPNWDCTPVLDEVFSDLKYAGIDGVEVMESILKHEAAVERLNALIKKYNLPVSGTSYYGNMWDKNRQSQITDDIELVVQRLRDVGGKMIGLTVGDAKRMKTEAELDTQSETLRKILAICKQNGVHPNLHNHTFEVTSGMHDLKGTLKRIPEISLGPDLNWLVRGGVDPATFIKTYAGQIVYMHIRDQAADGKWTDAVGEGVTNFPEIARALQDIKYKGRAAIELAFDAPPVRPVRESWKQSREYVRKVFGW